jgi:hypothetical protein
MEIAVKMVERSSKGAGGAGGSAGDSFLAAGIMGRRRPLAPSFMAS